MEFSSSSQAYFFNYWSDEVLTAVNNLLQELSAFCNCTEVCHGFKGKQCSVEPEIFSTFRSSFRPHTGREKPLEKSVTSSFKVTQGLREFVCLELYSTGSPSSHLWFWFLCGCRWLFQKLCYTLWYLTWTYFNLFVYCLKNIWPQCNSFFLRTVQRDCMFYLSPVGLIIFFFSLFSLGCTLQCTGTVCSWV